MLIKLIMLFFLLTFSVHSDDKNINEEDIQNIIEKYILENPEIIITKNILTNFLPNDPVPPVINIVLPLKSFIFYSHLVMLTVH